MPLSKGNSNEMSGHEDTSFSVTPTPASTRLRPPPRSTSGPHPCALSGHLAEHSNVLPLGLSLTSLLRDPVLPPTPIFPFATLLASFTGNFQTHESLPVCDLPCWTASPTEARATPAFLTPTAPERGLRQADQVPLSAK